MTELETVSEVNGILVPTEDLTIIGFTKEQQLSAASMNREEALALVRMYNRIQKLRIGCSNKESAFKRRKSVIADPLTVILLKEDLLKSEKKAEAALRCFAKAQPLGRWCMSIRGVDAVIAAGMLAHIDLTRCCCETYRHYRGEGLDIPAHDCPGLTYATKIWKYAGLVDRKCLQWEKGQKRPYNAELKNLCWQLGECFKRSSMDGSLLGSDGSHIPEDAKNRDRKVKAFLTRRKNMALDTALYCRLYRQRKQREVEQNDAGAFARKAAEMLEEARRKGFRISKEQRESWEAGRLQDVGLDRRACRYAVTIFLSHFYEVGKQLLGLPWHKPYVMEHGGHKDFIPAPNWPMRDE